MFLSVSLLNITYIALRVYSLLERTKNKIMDNRDDIGQNVDDWGSFPRRLCLQKSLVSLLPLYTSPTWISLLLTVPVDLLRKRRT